MTDLVVLVPTRSRPQAVAAMARSFADTCTADTDLVWLVDGCPQLNAYRDAYRDTTGVYLRQLLLVGSRRRLVGTLNYYATLLADAPYAIAYFGDDHRPRTRGWDSWYIDTLRELGTGLVYGNDLFQQENLPTQVAMTADIVRELGYMAPSCLTHMYCDNFWKDLGERAGCLRYLPDVVVQHLHPGAGEVAWDASYRESNSAESYAADKAAYERFRNTGGLDAAVRIVQQLRGEAT